MENFKAGLADNDIDIVGTINQTPFGKTVVVKDPDGYTLTFLQPYH